MRELAACSKICVYTTALQGIPIKEVARFRAALLATVFAARINPEIDTTKCQGIMPCAVRVPVSGPFLAAESWDRKCPSNVRGQQGPDGAKFRCPFVGPPKPNLFATRVLGPKRPREIWTCGVGKQIRRVREDEYTMATRGSQHEQRHMLLPHSASYLHCPGDQGRIREDPEKHVCMKGDPTADEAICA